MRNLRRRARAQGKRGIAVALTQEIERLQRLAAAMDLDERTRKEKPNGNTA